MLLCRYNSASTPADELSYQWTVQAQVQLIGSKFAEPCIYTILTTNRYDNSKYACFENLNLCLLK